MASFRMIGQGTIDTAASALRRACVVPLLLFLAACSGIIPDGGQRPAPTTPSATPAADGLHRVALLAPLTGENADIGQSIANAATLGYIDTQASTIRLTTYDTAKGAREAAQRALADGNGLILGPLLSDNVDVVASVARPAGVPVISFSNDASEAAPGTFLLGQMPSQAVSRVTRYAYGAGNRRFAALVPNNVYGTRAADAFGAAVSALGGTLVGVERYNRSSDAVQGAAKRLAAKGSYDALLIADNGRAAMLVAPIARSNGAGLATFLGTELWNTEADLATKPSLRGALFASVSDRLYSEFAERYRTQFGKMPFRLSTLGYDAALLTVSLSDEWRAGQAFPTGELLSPEGFVGLDGGFRFRSDGLVDRMFEVQRIDDGTFTVVEAAPSTFPDD